MITWLEGKLQERWKKGNRVGVMINCSGIGYEISLNHRDWECLPILQTKLSLYIHMIIRENQWILYGFLNRYDRDLFSEIISINGIGPQIAVSLQSTLGHVLLVNAIINGDSKMLSQAQGIGKRMAEKLSVELRDRLIDYCKSPGISIHLEKNLNNLPVHDSPLIIELENVLKSLGYKTPEIQRALELTQDSDMLFNNSDFDSWLRATLCILNQQTS